MEIRGVSCRICMYISVVVEKRLEWRGKHVSYVFEHKNRRLESMDVFKF